MSKKLPLLWPLQPHTKAKHDILRKYLQAWMRIITLGISRRAIIIDGFAGPGEYNKGEDGSPIIVLKECIETIKQVTSMNRDIELRCIFIEQDNERFQNLKYKIAELFNDSPKNIKEDEAYCPPGFDKDELLIFLYNATFVKTMNLILERIKKLAPTFAFIDPFGFKDTPYDLIEKFVKNDKSEVFINFMYEDINRFLKLESLQKHYHQLFGTNKWQKIIENIDSYTPSERRYFLHKLYQYQLHKAGLDYVISFEMKNEKNATDYFLYYGTKHIKGLEKMKDAMWAVDNSGAYTFSDYEAEQAQLKFVEFDEPDINILADEIYSKFKGEKIKCDKVKDFIVTDTIFRRSKHANAALKILEEKGLLIVHNRRKHGFPDYVDLDFI